MPKIPLSVLFNHSFSLGIFSDVLKIAQVVPVCRSNETSDLTNYCPICDLSCLSKILEKLICSKLNLHQA